MEAYLPHQLLIITARFVFWRHRLQIKGMYNNNGMECIMMIPVIGGVCCEIQRGHNQLEP